MSSRPIPDFAQKGRLQLQNLQHITQILNRRRSTPTHLPIRLCLFSALCTLYSALCTLRYSCGS